MAELVERSGRRHPTPHDRRLGSTFFRSAGRHQRSSAEDRRFVWCRLTSEPIRWRNITLAAADIRCGNETGYSGRSDRRAGRQGHPRRTRRCGRAAVLAGAAWLSPDHSISPSPTVRPRLGSPPLWPRAVAWSPTCTRRRGGYWPTTKAMRRSLPPGSAANKWAHIVVDAFGREPDFAHHAGIVSRACHCRDAWRCGDVITDINRLVIEGLLP